MGGWGEATQVMKVPPLPLCCEESGQAAGHTCDAIRENFLCFPR